MTAIPVTVLVCGAIAAGGVVGYRYAQIEARTAVAEAIAVAAKEGAKRNEEVVNGWAAAVNLLRERIRAGAVPRIPLPSAPSTGNTPSVPVGSPTNPVPDARELGTCKRERQRLIEDCTMTTIQLQSLQTWAKEN